MARAHWASRFGFIMVTAGSAVGLGNIWKFPYITGKYGGSAFVLVYLLAILATGIPIFLAELYIGQASQKNVVGAFRVLSGRKTRWTGVGWLGLLAGFFVLGFYSVVGGWVLQYLFHSLNNGFAGVPEADVRAFLDTLMASPLRMIFWQCLFMALTMGIVWGGIASGIERWNKILMPGLIALLLLLLVRSFFLPGFSQALAFLFEPDFSKLTPEALLEALGHSFFTLSLGMGTMVTYGSYLSRKTRLSSVAFSVILLDTAIALVAGLVTFTAVFSFGVEPQAGPALMFQTLPSLFQNIAGSYWVGVAFFLLVAFAALTSAVSLLEPVVTYCVDARGWKRAWSVPAMGGIVTLVGISAALSFNVLSGWKVGGDGIFDLLAKLSTNVLLPLGGMLLSLYYGWVLGPKAVEATLEGTGIGQWGQWGLLWSTRLLAPLAVAVVLFNAIRHW